MFMLVAFQTGFWLKSTATAAYKTYYTVNLLKQDWDEFSNY